MLLPRNVAWTVATPEPLPASSMPGIRAASRAGVATIHATFWRMNITKAHQGICADF